MNARKLGEIFAESLILSDEEGTDDIYKLLCWGSNGNVRLNWVEKLADAYGYGVIRKDALVPVGWDEVRHRRDFWEYIYTKPWEMNMRRLSKHLVEREHQVWLRDTKRLYQVYGIQLALAWADGEKDVDFDKIEPPYYGEFEGE